MLGARRGDREAVPASLPGFGDDTADTDTFAGDIAGGA